MGGSDLTDSRPTWFGIILNCILLTLVMVTMSVALSYSIDHHD